MDPKTKDKRYLTVIRSRFVVLIVYDYSESHLQVASKAILAGVTKQSLRAEFGLFGSLDQLSAFFEFPHRLPSLDAMPSEFCVH